jgi:hypothetical protein
VTDEEDLRGRVARLSLEQKVRLLTGEDFWALYPEPDAGLRRVVLSDGPAKHFVASDSETERMTVDVRVDERTLRELYLVPFEAIVHEAGAWAVMAAYNGVNGSTMTESPLLRDILHDEWGTDDEEIAAAVWIAAASDVAVVVVGTTAEVESEGFDRPSLALPGRQDELVRRIAAANPRTVVVVN